MIKVKLLPDMKELIFRTDTIKVEELLRKLDVIDLESITILVNNKLVEDLNHEIKRGDKVILIRQATGG
ncbi:MAG: thiamine biosynthesis protein ThiS [Desulfurococcales archaeon ex4484_58]|nr:MAG: thiamine biosynthesis protein ThiS [Desulfurococcales archaeon ex4484_58]